MKSVGTAASAFRRCPERSRRAGGSGTTVEEANSQAVTYTLASQANIGSRPTCVAATSFSCVIPLHFRPAGVAGQFGTTYSAAGIRQSVRNRIVREIRHHDHRILPRHSSLPNQHTLVVVEILPRSIQYFVASKVVPKSEHRNVPRCLPKRPRPRYS